MWRAARSREHARYRPSCADRDGQRIAPEGTPIGSARFAESRRCHDGHQEGLSLVTERSANRLLIERVKNEEMRGASVLASLVML
jgi:putative component of membrane protein insertase Oxa1/YidC/SpoIIIJ protein YidD